MRIFLAFLLLLLTRSVEAAAPTLGTVTSNNTSSSVNTLTVSCDAGSGSNRVLYGIVGQRNQTISSFTFNGAALTHVEHDSSSSTNSLFVYRITAPDTGVHDLVVTLSGTVTQLVIVCLPMSGVDQTTPEDTVTIVTPGTGSPISGAITSGAVDDIVMGTAYLTHGGGSGTITPTVGTDILNLDNLFGARSFGFSQTASDTTSKTLTWTATATPGIWRMIMWNVNQVAASGSAVKRRATGLY